MDGDQQERAAYYAMRLREAQELAAKATNPQTREMWNGIVEGYRMLLSNLQNRKSRTSNEN